MKIKRILESTLLRASKEFKAVVVTGPRQSGKTTCVRMAFPDKPYISLEDPSQRMQAMEDPKSFLGRFPTGAILDEAQRVPELFSFLQQILDESPMPGKFIITGSQQLGLAHTISQTLAGRVAVLELLPFSYSEALPFHREAPSLDEVLFQGGYPPIFDQKPKVEQWYDSYVSTYLERDVRSITQVQDLVQFQRFLMLCAANTGHLFNATRLGNDCGLNATTITKWLSILEGTYVAFRLQPYFQNFRKRIVKTPKLYFWDTGLAVRLLGIETPHQLATHPLRGMIFENWVVVEHIKKRFNKGQRSNFYFWRDNTGLEVDLIQDNGGRLAPTEIKSGATLAKDWLKGLKKWKTLAGENAEGAQLVYGGMESFPFQNVAIRAWNQIDHSEENDGRGT